MKRRPIKNAPPSMLINEISKLFNDKMRQKTEALGMSEGYRRLLFHLSHNDQLSQLELVKRTHLSAPSVSVALQKMESEGLVIRESSEQDQRTVLVRLTEAGFKADRKIIGAIRETEQQMLCGISEEQIAAFRPILERMYQNLREGQPLCGKEQKDQ